MLVYSNNHRVRLTNADDPFDIPEDVEYVEMLKFDKIVIEDFPFGNLRLEFEFKWDKKCRRKYQF